MSTNELKPFRLLPYGTKFRYQGTQDVWVRTQHNVIAEWPCRIWSADGSPRSSLCCFCHLDGDEDGNTLDTLVEVIDLDSQLAALREELEPKTVKELLEHEHVKALSAKQINDVLSKLHEQNKDLQQRLADAERRNMFCESMLRQIMPCLAMSTNTTAPTYMRQIDAALNKPEEAKS